MQFLNRVKVAIATTGTGSVTVSTAADGMLTPAQAGAVDGVQSTWILEEGLDWEIFKGTPSSTATVISRDTVEKSFISGTPGTTKMTLGGAATLRAIVSAADMIAPRERLLADRTYYVRTDGSDSNNGLADTLGGAFLTIQKAINVVAMLDLGGFAVTIQVGTGTYTGAVAVATPFIGGNVTLKGDTTTPSNVVISTTSANAITVSNKAVLLVQGFKLQTTTSGYGIQADSGGNVKVNGNMNYGAAAGGHLYAQTDASIIVTANYTISGAAPFHWIATDHGIIFTWTSGGVTATVSGTPAFSSYFAYADRAALVTCHNMTFSGSATGPRYYAQGNAVIFVNGAGATYLPGNSAGSTVTGGQYL